MSQNRHLEVISSRIKRKKRLRYSKRLPNKMSSFLSCISSSVSNFCFEKVKKINKKPSTSDWMNDIYFWLDLKWMRLIWIETNRHVYAQQPQKNGPKTELKLTEKSFSRKMLKFQTRMRDRIEQKKYYIADTLNFFFFSLKWTEWREKEKKNEIKSQPFDTTNEYLNSSKWFICKSVWWRRSHYELSKTTKNIQMAAKTNKHHWNAHHANKNLQKKKNRKNGF